MTLEIPIAIRELLPEDIQDLYDWRNHPTTRSNSFKTEAIAWETHEAWFKNKIGNSESIIYMACCGAQKIGSVRFDIREGNAMVSVMLNPDFRGRGLAARVIRLAVDRFIKKQRVNKTVIAEIKKDNITSAKAFQRAGFCESHVTYVLSSDTELNYENKIEKEI